jgi:hypothetical protein
MSGGGGGGGVTSGGGGIGGGGSETGGSGGGTNDAVQCQTVYKGAGLASPKNNVLSKLKPGDTLDLEAHQQGTSYVLYASKAGKKAGTVTHKVIDQIIKCIVEGGYTYIAYIKVLEGGNCSLEIRMES